MNAEILKMEIKNAVKEALKETRIPAEKVQVGDTIKTWFGTHRIIKIEPYAGARSDIMLNILVFENGSKMSNEKGSMYNGYKK